AAAGQTLGHLALARFCDDGEGVAQDMALADRHFRAAMAPLLKPPQRRADDPPDADPLEESWFEASWGEGKERWEEDRTPERVVLVDGLRQQMMKPSAYFRGQLGEKLLADLVATTPMAAALIGQWYLCADCGSAVKPAEAARWLRRGVEAGSMHSAYVL